MILPALNLALLVCYPVSWFLPLAHAGLLPWFGMEQLTIISGIISLWESDPFLTVLVAVFAMVLPMIKTLALALVHVGRLRRRALPMLSVIGRFAMADVFLVALYILLAQGVGVGRIETGWGLYFFTACVLASLILTELTKRRCG